MTPRIDLPAQASEHYRAMYALERAITLDTTLKVLVKLRASQINGCAYCIDMHWKDGRAAGESEERLYMLGAWRESPLYDDRERAALALCEAMTNISETRVPDDVWDVAAKQFDEGEIANLIFAIAAINTWNRLAITSRAEPGLYQPPGR